MTWYVVHTKPRQERRALDNLIQQDYECYLPTLQFERIQNGQIKIVLEAMFPRYLFINLNESATGKSWAPIRSTKGVHRLVTFGSEPAKIDADTIEKLRVISNEGSLYQPLFQHGERIVLNEGPFAGMEGIYQALAKMQDGESRALVLIELLQKTTILSSPLASIKKMP